MRREQQQLCLSGRLLSGYLLGIHGRVSPGAGQGQGNIEELHLKWTRIITELNQVIVAQSGGWKLLFHLPQN